MEVLKKLVKWVVIGVVVLIAIMIILPKVTGNGKSASTLEKQAVEAYQNKDMKKATDLALKACKKGSANACGMMSGLYMDQKNYKKCSSFSLKACDGGNPIGCYNLGMLYANGFDVEQDREKGKKLIQKSCDLGFNQACKVINEYFN